MCLLIDGQTWDQLSGSGSSAGRPWARLQLHAEDVDLDRGLVGPGLTSLGPGFFLSIAWGLGVAHAGTPASQGTPKPRDLILWTPSPPDARTMSPRAVTRSA